MRWASEAMAGPAPLTPLRIVSKAGVKRDGTQFEGDYNTDSQWCRWDRGKPRKMGGYRLSSVFMHGPSRGMILHAEGLITQLHNGWEDGIERVQIDNSGLALGPPVDRTPAGFAADPENLWISDVMYNVGATNTAILAVAPLSATSIANETPGTIYFGDINGAAALTALAPTDGPASTAGGLFVVPPYLFVYDVAGYLTWSAPNEPDNFATADGGGGTAGGRIAKTKLVGGLPLRGGPGNSPAFLVWSLDSLIRGSFVGGTPVFSFDTVSADITVMSQKALIEYDGVYIWPGLDRFYVFNGVVRELPNDLNRNWFFDNLNYDHAEKVFAFKNPRWGEIWICFPFGTATECTHALIYNIRLNTWYSTVLPNGGRSGAAMAQILRYPMMMGAIEIGSSGLYRLWQHEFGTNEIIDASTVNAIQSYFDTQDFTLPTGMLGDAVEKWLDISRLDPDLVLAGNLTVTQKTRKYPMADSVDAATKTFDPSAFDPAQPQSYTVPLKNMGRINRFRFESNVVDGNFQMGETLAMVRAVEQRQ